MPRKRPEDVALATLTIALLLVGIVSGTVWRHLVQAAPAAGAWLLGLRRPALGRAAAVPVFAFWLGIMLLIWLFLLGVARVVTGQFSPAEVALTVVIGGASVAGLVAAARGRGRIEHRDVLVAVTVAVLQIGAMWLSLQPWVAAR